MRFRVTAKGAQQSMPRIPPTHQPHLLETVKYKDLEKGQRGHQMAQREDGRVTDAKQARMRGRITVICVESASPSPTHGEQPGRNVVQDRLLRQTNSLSTRFWAAGLSYLIVKPGIVKPGTLVAGRECTRTGASAPYSIGHQSKNAGSGGLVCGLPANSTRQSCPHARRDRPPAPDITFVVVCRNS